MPRPSAALAFVYSGGPANTSPSLSLGGQVSTAAGRRVASQNMSGAGIPGVTILYATRNPLGAGTLAYNQPTGSLSWTPFGGSADTVVVSAGGEFALGQSTNTGFIVVNVVPASLPGSNASVPMTASDVDGTIFGTPASNELENGATEYRCLYLVNVSTSDVTDITVTLTQDTPLTQVYIGSDYAPLSNYQTPESDFAGYGFYNYSTGTPPVLYTPLELVREAMNLTDRVGLPVFQYSPAPAPQNSNGVDEDLPVLLTNKYDSDNKLGLVTWGTSLNWPSLPAGRMVSFFLKRVVPPATTGTGTEKLHLDLSLTVG